jgi:hypothetical protein
MIVQMMRLNLPREVATIVATMKPYHPAQAHTIRFLEVNSRKEALSKLRVGSTDAEDVLMKPLCQTRWRYRTQVR